MEETLLLGLSISGTHSAVGVSIEFLLEEAFDFDILPNLNLKGASLKILENTITTNFLHDVYLKSLKKYKKLKNQWYLNTLTTQVSRKLRRYVQCVRKG